MRIAWRGEMGILARFLVGRSGDGADTYECFAATSRQNDVSEADLMIKT
jgi:hypothetical protein